jgi:hypothetical protein
MSPVTWRADDVRRLRALADERTANQRLVLTCQAALDMDCHEFLHRTTPLGKSLTGSLRPG